MYIICVLSVAFTTIEETPRPEASSFKNISRLNNVTCAEKVFLDTVVKTNSISESFYSSSESDNEISSDNDSGDEVSYSSSSSNSSSEWEEYRNHVIDHLNISYDDDFLDQSSETPEFDPDKTSMDELDMDITSELELGTIELNAPCKPKLHEVRQVRQVCESTCWLAWQAYKLRIVKCFGLS